MSGSIKFQNLSNPVKFSTEQKNYVNSLGELKGTEWDDNKNNPIMKSIKDTILTQLEAIQNNYCIYCGGHKDKVARSGWEREHIACKNGKKIKYPQFMFEPFNLVLACHDCNKLKSYKNTISKLNPDYKKCEFSIIHPFFDKFENNILFMNKNKDNSDAVILVPTTQKGKNTIEMFKLNDLYQVEDRGKCMKLDEYEIFPVHEQIISNILSINRNAR